MGIFDRLYQRATGLFSLRAMPATKFVQYHHLGRCKTPCADCPPRDKRVYENGKHVVLPAHPNCDCFYTGVESVALGSISVTQPAPDVWLKNYGILPEYYITKQEATEKYGWNSRRNTVAGKAPGKMIGGDAYLNSDCLLPEAEGRVWYECDVDYENGTRASARLFYSNDGLMFYSPDHLAGEVTVYLVE